MNFQERQKQLLQLYARFESGAQPYTASAVCRRGCADCCINVGRVDITTLEGLIILNHLQDLSPSSQKKLNRKLKENRRLRSESRYARCAFLAEDDSCSIYVARPFSCRRLYSLKPCGETGPTVHRHVWNLAEEIEKAIQLLDDNGYSGHISYILQLLKDSRFRKTYLSDGFAPQQIHELVRKYRLFINRYAAPSEPSPSPDSPTA